MFKFFRAVSGDYARSILVSLLSVLIVIPLTCVFIFIPLWLVNQFDFSIWVLIGSAGLFLLVLFGGGFGALAWTFYRRKRWLDSLFIPWGLAGSAYMISGRQYQGSVQGREIIARFYRGPTLDLYVGTPLQTRLGIAEKSQTGLALAGMLGRQPISLAAPDLEALSVFALDEEWARSLLARPEARMLLQRLMKAGESWVLIQQVYLQPGAFHLRLYRNKNLFRYDIEPAEVREWLDDLMALARVAEGLPAPQVTDDESGAEQLVRSGGVTGIGLGVVALLVGVPTCILAIVAAIFFVLAIQ